MKSHFWALLGAMTIATAIAFQASANEDRTVGSLLGLAVGDAMGVTQEKIPRLVSDPAEIHTAVLKQRKMRRQFRGFQTQMEGKGPFAPSLILNPGEFTDDTSMALCLADSLIAKATLDPTDVMEHFEKWATEGYNSSRYEKKGSAWVGIQFGIGSATRNALQRYREIRPINPIAGGTDPRRDAGNGSIMRLAPVPIYWWNDLETAVKMARLQSSLTHATPEALDASSFLAEILVRAYSGESKENIFISKLQFEDPGIAELAKPNAAWRHKTVDEIRTLPGRALWTLEAALWAINKTESFEDAIVEAINLGGDADTVGAVTGQIAGALYGEKAIPEKWIKALAFHETIRRKALALYYHHPESPELAIHPENR